MSLEILEIASLTLRVSGLATLIAVLLGIPFGVWLGVTRFKFQRIVAGAVNTGMGLPPTVVGLIVSFLLWRSGPLGFLGLMYTPAAMVIAQSIIALPVVAGLTMAAIQQLDPRLRLQLVALGASPRQVTWYLVREARLGILAAVMGGFGAAVSEVGASMAVGGNIRGETRVLTTAIVLEISKGNFKAAGFLSLLLTGLSFGVTYLLTVLQQRRRRDTYGRG